MSTDQFRDLLISYDNADDQLAARCDWLARCEEMQAARYLAGSGRWGVGTPARSA